MFSHDRIDLEQARRKFARVWLIGVAGIIVTLLIQMMFGTYHKFFSDVLSWTAPHLAPTTGLVIGTIANTAIKGPSVKRPTVDGFFVRLGILVSIVYLALILIFLLSGGIFAEFQRADNRVDAHFSLLELGNLWLGLFQGALAAVFGSIFFTEKSDEKKPDS